MSRVAFCIERGRAAYNLMRFVKVVRPHLQVYAADIISSVRDLLAVITTDELVREPARFDCRDPAQSLNPDDQHFVFEAIGSIIAIEGTSAAVCERCV